MGSTGFVFKITEMSYIFHDVFSLQVTTTSLLGCGHTDDPTNNEDVHRISWGSFSWTIKFKASIVERGYGKYYTIRNVIIGILPNIYHEGYDRKHRPTALTRKMRKTYTFCNKASVLYVDMTIMYEMNTYRVQLQTRFN
jgi:hypothetical protein